MKWTEVWVLVSFPDERPAGALLARRGWFRRAEAPLESSCVAAGAPRNTTMTTQPLPSSFMFDPEQAHSAFNEVHSALLALEPAQVVPVRVDVPLTCAACLLLAKDVEQPDIRRSLIALSGFNVLSLEALPRLAWATWHANQQLSESRAREQRELLSGELMVTELARRERMIWVLDFHLGDEPRVAEKLASIREGQGFRHLASDLTRLANLFHIHQAELERDRRHFDPADEQAARNGARRLLERVATGRTESVSRWLDLQSRAFTLLAEAHTEICAAGRWIYRADPEVEERFPGPFALSRATLKLDAPSDGAGLRS